MSNSGGKILKYIYIGLLVSLFGFAVTFNLYRVSTIIFRDNKINPYEELSNINSPEELNNIDKTLYLGEYQTNYLDEIETITLKENGNYDYHHKDKNITIIDAGKWILDRSHENHTNIELRDFPVRRQKPAFNYVEEKFNVSFYVSQETSSLGDLYIIVGDKADYYTFEKLDK